MFISVVSLLVVHIHLQIQTGGLISLPMVQNHYFQIPLGYLQVCLSDVVFYGKIENSILCKEHHCLVMEKHHIFSVIGICRTSNKSPFVWFRSFYTCDTLVVFMPCSKHPIIRKKLILLNRC